MVAVKIYIKSWCSYCQEALTILRQYPVSLDIVDIEGDADLTKQMQHASGGRTSVPQIFIDGKHVGGCDDLKALQEKGTLDKMLASS